MDFDTIVSQISRGSVIKFQEYRLSRREIKQLVMEIDGAVVQEVIQPNQQLSRDVLELYYGEGLDDVTYLQLSSVNCWRIAVIMGTDEESRPIYKVLMLSRGFYEAGLQTLELLGNRPLEEPNYSQQMAMNFPQTAPFPGFR